MSIDLSGYSFLSATQIRLLEGRLPQAATGIYIKVIGECGCVSIYHPLFANQQPIILNCNGELIGKL